MMYSERLERIKPYYNEDVCNDDAALATRIRLLLNNPLVDEGCPVDAYYYDFSAIPRDIQEELNLWRDAYLIYGVTTAGTLVSRWVDRWDLDSNDPIVDGKVVDSHVYDGNSRVTTTVLPPEIMQQFNPMLLFSPTILPSCGCTMVFKRYEPKEGHEPS